jgi:hypothetical protein
MKTIALVPSNPQKSGQLVDNPLEKNFSFFDFGKYTQALNDKILPT